MMELLLIAYLVYVILGFLTYFYWYIDNKREFELYIIEIHTFAKHPWLAFAIDILLWPIFWIFKYNERN